jgi:hypothetical protein
MLSENRMLKENSLIYMRKNMFAKLGKFHNKDLLNCTLRQMLLW